MLVLAEIHLALKLEGQALSCLMSVGLATASGREGVLSIEPYSSYCALSTSGQKSKTPGPSCRSSRLDSVDICKAEGFGLALAHAGIQQQQHEHKDAGV